MNENTDTKEKTVFVVFFLDRGKLWFDYVFESKDEAGQRILELNKMLPQNLKEMSWYMYETYLKISDKL